MLLTPIPTPWTSPFCSALRSKLEGCFHSGKDLHTPWGDMLEILRVQKWDWTFGV